MRERVLIANRGEIAIRVAEAAHSVGMEPVVVSVAADSGSLHRRAGAAHVELPTPSGGPVAGYLDISAIVEAAVAQGCRYLHPGYGFLSESPDLARACRRAEVTFVGPAPEALELFGDKVRARRLATSLDIPIVRGSAALASPADAAAAAAEIGFPVMLKAAAGGGGRGMRRVDDPDRLDEEFGRCSSEARAAFGDGTVFVEALLERPRHIEVQVLADDTGTVIQLGERDCSVQLRHQKVVEIAPAVDLPDTMRSRVRRDAVRLARAGGLTNAATVEFLVVPETESAFFIECNPRIQVEHTVTEEVTGVDLVSTQLRLAAGETLDEIGLHDVGAIDRFAVQARVSLTGGGTFTAYREPGGHGVRTDGCGYLGWSPPPSFDPLFAKVIGSSATSLGAALATTRRAVTRFDVEGVSTNLPALAAILGRPELASGDARTTFLSENPELLDAPTTVEGDGGGVHSPAVTTTHADVTVEDHQVPITSPADAAVVEVLIGAGDEVVVGQPLLVTTAMKMETVISAPESGIVEQLAALSPGDPVRRGQVIAAIGPETTGRERSDAAAPPWAETLDQIATLRVLAEERLAPGSTDPGVVRQRERGKLTCRERIDLLIDADSFREVGSAAGFASYDDEGDIVAFTPANSVGGTGTIDGREVVVCADDFTSRGGHADGAIAAKSFTLDQLSTELRVPSIRLLDGSSGGGSVAQMVPQQRKSGDSSAKESRGAITAGRPRVAGGGGSFLPGHLGSTEYAEQLATVPVVNVLMGSVVGLGAAKAVLGHFSVMVRDIAQLMVAGPPVVSHAMGVDVSKEELGGWEIHALNGSVDNLAETEAEAMAMTRRFLSYLPDSVFDPPPRVPCDDPVDRVEEELAWIIPRKRTTTFDVRRVIELLADRGSFFEIGTHWGTDQVTGFARFDGHVVGIIASDSRHVNGGALTADGCDKLTRHIDLCDLFHVPLINLVDNPGFAVGIEHESAGTIRRGGTWMVAFAQATVPIYTVIMRRSFGVAGNNYATPRRAPTARVVWPAADVGGIPPEGGIEAAYKRQLADADDPVALRAELEARIESARGPLGPLSRFQMEEMVDPRDTRRLICEWLPTAVRVAGAADRLGPRGLGFRP